MLNNEDKSTGPIKFMGRMTHQIFTAPCKIKNNGLFHVKLIPNNNTHYVHSNNAKFKCMLWYRRIIHRSLLKKTIKLINPMSAVCDSPKKDCWTCTSTNVPRAPKTHDYR